MLFHDRLTQVVVLDDDSLAAHMRLSSRIQIKTIAYCLSRLSEVHVGTVRDLSQNKLLSENKSVSTRTLSVLAKEGNSP